MSTTPHNYDHERQLWDAFSNSAFADSSLREGVPPAFSWTQYPGHGPGPELLGDPTTVLEIGCGTGRALAHLAQNGVKATGVDLSPAMTAKAAKRWGPLGARFVCAEVLTHLRMSRETYDAIYSVFGAVWFTDPCDLLPLVAKHLNPGGRFVFAHPPAIPGTYGPQGMYKGGFAGPAVYAYRYSYPPEGWAGFLSHAGFTDIDARIIDAPRHGHIGTLIVQATIAPPLG